MRPLTVPRVGSGAQAPQACHPVCGSTIGTKPPESPQPCGKLQPPEFQVSNSKHTEPPKQANVGVGQESPLPPSAPPSTTLPSTLHPKPPYPEAPLAKETCNAHTPRSLWEREIFYAPREAPNQPPAGGEEAASHHTPCSVISTVATRESPWTYKHVVQEPKSQPQGSQRPQAPNRTVPYRIPRPPAPPNRGGPGPPSQANTSCK